MANLTFDATDVELDFLADLDLTDLYKIWAQTIEAVTIRAFQRETSPAGQRWEPLKAKTIARRNARVSPPTRGKILLDKGNLYDSIFASVQDGAVIAGSNIIVGDHNLLGIHQYGAPKANIVPRPALPMDEDGNLIPSVQQMLVEDAEDFFMA